MEIKPLDTLSFDPENARRRTQRSAQMIRDSLCNYGVGRSIAIDEQDQLLAGEGTVRAALENGITDVLIVEPPPGTLVAVRMTGLTKEQKAGYALADNRSSDLSVFDGATLQELSNNLDLSQFWDDQELATLLGAAQDLPDELAPISDKHDSSTQQTYMYFGKYKIPLTDEELTALTERYEVHTQTAGTTYGFVAYLLGGNTNGL